MSILDRARAKVDDFGAKLVARKGWIPYDKKVDSMADERVVNNVVRHEYRVLTENEKAQMKQIKDLGLALLEYIDSIGPSRELSIAKTKTEEAVMWAVKSITK